jgi:hypothetical protein
VDHIDTIQQAQTMDRSSVRVRATELFDTDRIVDEVIVSLHDLSARIGRRRD